MLACFRYFRCCCYCFSSLYAFMLRESIIACLWLWLLFTITLVCFVVLFGFLRHLFVGSYVLASPISLTPIGRTYICVNYTITQFNLSTHAHKNTFTTCMCLYVYLYKFSLIFINTYLSFHLNFSLVLVIVLSFPDRCFCVFLFSSSYFSLIIFLVIYLGLFCMIWIHWTT